MMARRNRRLSRLSSCSWMSASALPWLAGTAIAGALVLSLAFGDMGVGRYVRMAAQVERLEQDILRLKQTNAQLEGEIKRIQQDPLRVEELAREQLGFVKPGETVYQLIKPDPSDATRDLSGL